MNQIELFGKSIEALKSFNNTIVTCRLYPPEAPQVITAINRGYTAVKFYLGLYGNLEYSLKGRNPCLCGQPLTQEILNSFPNLVVYRQLLLLGLSKLVLSSDLDRFAFGQLLSVFKASVEKIKSEGGGADYIISLGLASYFSETTGQYFENTGNLNRTGGFRARSLEKVRPEIVACLFGKDKRPVIEEELQTKMATASTAVDTLTACIVHILLDIQKRKRIVASPYFPLMLKNAETLIATANREEVALGLAKVFVDSLNEPALGVLVVQEYPDGFGCAVSDALIALLTTEKLAGTIRLLKDQLVKAKRVGEVNSSLVQCLEKGLNILVNSKKGKQFLRTEKVRETILDGEKERRKRRLEAGVQGLLQGNISLLKSEELVAFLPDAIRQIQKKTDGTEVSSVLDNMVAYLREGGEEVKEPILKSLIAIGETLIADGRRSQVDHLLELLVDQIRKGGAGDRHLEKIVTLLQQVMQKSWEDENNDRGDGILRFFFQIRSGQIPCSASIKMTVGKVQDRGIRRAYLQHLIAQSLAAPADEALSFRLIHQGPIALRFLVDSLITTDNASDRLKIIDLLMYSPDYLPSIVHERLQEHMTWHGKRNLIKLLGETGREEDAESILPYLRHEDLRVQRETFLTLYRIGGGNKKILLLRALEECSESIKIQIVEALATFCDPEVAGKLVELLASHEQFSEKNRNDFLLQLLDTLGRCPCPEAYKGVHTFLQTRGQRATGRIPDQIWVLAEKALKFLENELQQTRKKHIQASQLRKNSLLQATKMSKSVVPQRVITGLPQEQAVRRLVARGDKTKAAAQLLELIERTARLRNFVQAEKLREWLIEIDSMALSQIFRAAEIIDQEKIASIDKSHLEIWSGLYDILTTDEFSAVYHALKHRRYKNEEIVINQGALQATLFFINSGKVKLYFADKGHEVLVKTMGRGEIFGGGAFFEASVWTISVAAIEPSELSILKQNTLQKWTEDFPGLESKLYDFCKKTERVEDFIKRSSNDRRVHKRYQISGRVITTLVDNRGRSIETNSMAELCDISEGGLSFLLRISQKENGRLLLGRKMQVKLPMEEKDGDSITLGGEILAVKNIYAVEQEYSLHMKFDSLIDRRQLQDIVTAMSQESKVIE